MSLMFANKSLSDDNLISSLRGAASTWFKNSNLLLLEELIRRYRYEKLKPTIAPPQTRET